MAGSSKNNSSTRQKLTQRLAIKTDSQVIAATILATAKSSISKVQHGVYKSIMKSVGDEFQVTLIH